MEACFNSARGARLPNDGLFAKSCPVVSNDCGAVLLAACGAVVLAASSLASMAGGRSGPYPARDRTSGPRGHTLACVACFKQLSQ